MHHLVIQLVLHQLVNQASEVAMEALVAGDQLIGEGQPGHQPTLLQPINSAEAPAKKDALHARETDEPLVERAVLVHPVHCPLRLSSMKLELQKIHSKEFEQIRRTETGAEITYMTIKACSTDL